MPEPLDEFDAALRGRIGAAEARVRVSTSPPEGRLGAQHAARWLRPAMMFATAAAAVVLAVAVLGQLPDRSAGDATPTPSADGSVSASARNGDLVLTLSSPRSIWTTEDDIEITATLSYEGDEREVEIGGGGGPVVFSMRQLEGGNLELGGGQDLPCLRYRLGPDSPLVWPFEKAGAIHDEPPFDRAFFEDPELHLPSGRWEVRAFLQYGIGECSDLRLEVSIQLDVLEAEGSPRPSAVATEPPVSSAPPSPPASTVSGILHGDPQLEIACIWLRDDAGNAWEIIWPSPYRQEFRDGEPVLVRDDRVVARAGARITVSGAIADGGSWCAVGIVYEALAVQGIEPDP